MHDKNENYAVKIYDSADAQISYDDILNEI